MSRTGLPSYVSFILERRGTRAKLSVHVAVSEGLPLAWLGAFPKFVFAYHGGGGAGPGREPP